MPVGPERTRTVYNGRLFLASRHLYENWERLRRFFHYRRYSAGTLSAAQPVPHARHRRFIGFERTNDGQVPTKIVRIVA